MKHTRGPWAIDAVMSEALHDIVLDYEIPKAGNPILVASVYGHEEGGRPGDISGLEAEANARLIAAAPDLLAALDSPTWLVWSNEHVAWWAANEQGYTVDIASAGRYSLDQAIRICRTARVIGRNPDELIQPSPEWIATRAAAIAKAKGTS